MNTSLTLKQRRNAIRQRMQSIRSDLPQSMVEAREGVSNLTDWKFYVRSYPHIVLPIVAAAAFSLVPSAKRTQAPQLAFLGSEQGVSRVRFVEDDLPKKSIAAGVVSSLLALALRSGSSIAMRQLSSMFHRQLNQNAEALK
jgi:hypothetical protein